MIRLDRLPAASCEGVARLLATLFWVSLLDFSEGSALTTTYHGVGKFCNFLPPMYLSCIFCMLVLLVVVSSPCWLVCLLVGLLMVSGFVRLVDLLLLLGFVGLRDFFCVYLLKLTWMSMLFLCWLIDWLAGGRFGSWFGHSNHVLSVLLTQTVAISWPGLSAWRTSCHCFAGLQNLLSHIVYIESLQYRLLVGSHNTSRQIATSWCSKTYSKQWERKSLFETNLAKSQIPFFGPCSSEIAICASRTLVFSAMKNQKPDSLPWLPGQSGNYSKSAG